MGVRGTHLPAEWAIGEATEIVTVQGVAFSGVSVPVDTSDSRDIGFLLKGLEKSSRGDTDEPAV